MSGSYRIGIKTGLPFFPNAGIFVVKLAGDQVAKIQNAVSEIKTVLTIAGRGDIADKIVFEFRK